MVNNFGWTDVKADTTLADGDPDAFKKIVDVNIMSTYYMSKYVVQQMKTQQNGGNIVNISSVAGNTPDIARLAYGVSKSAINSLTQQSAIEYARDNIRVNAILPDLVATGGALDNMSDTFLETFLKHVPLNPDCKVT